MTTHNPHTWLPATDAPEGVEVMTKIDDADGVRNVRALMRQGRMWLYPDRRAHVYYTPTHYSLMGDKA